MRVRKLCKKRASEYGQLNCALFRLALFSLLLLIVVRMSFGQENPEVRTGGLFLKFRGGLAFLGGGDFNDLVKVNEINPALTGIKKSSFFGNISGEVGYDFGKLMVSVESGYITRAFNVTVDETSYKGPWDRSFSAIPRCCSICMSRLWKTIPGDFISMVAGDCIWGPTKRHGIGITGRSMGENKRVGKRRRLSFSYQIARRKMSSYRFGIRWC